MPEECLNIDIAKINHFCKSRNEFILSGDWVRPFERLQFIRGTEQFYIDLITKPKRMFEVIEKLHGPDNSIPP